MYTKDTYKNEIRKFISFQGYDPKAVARQTYNLYFEHIRELEHKLRDKLLDIATMENGSEFEMTEKEFNNFLDDI